MPANGLLYTHPSGCSCGAYSESIRTFQALISRPFDEHPPFAEAGRFEEGPAYGKQATHKASSTGWPTFRANSRRTGSSSTEIPLDFDVLWTTDFGYHIADNLKSDWAMNPHVSGPLSAPVVMDDQVFAALPDRHAVVCLDRDTGKENWRFMADGRVDSPPTLYKGRCYFGSNDGGVYCVNAADGQLSWRLRAAPRALSISAYGQPESLWPVHGSVLIHQGKLRVAAGRHRHIDGRISEYEIDPDTGEVLSEKQSTMTIASILVTKEEPYVDGWRYGHLDPNWTRFDSGLATRNGIIAKRGELTVGYQFRLPRTKEVTPGRLAAT